MLEDPAAGGQVKPDVRVQDPMERERENKENEQCRERPLPESPRCRC